LGSTHSSLSTIFFVVLAFFPENQLGLPTIATPLPVITPFSLGIQRILAVFVLCHFMRLVLATLFTESWAGFRNINLFDLTTSVPCPETRFLGSLLPVLDFFGISGPRKGLVPSGESNTKAGARIKLM
jgi:hypothetical protein